MPRESILSRKATTQHRYLNYLMQSREIESKCRRGQSSPENANAIKGGWGEQGVICSHASLYPIDSKPEE
ncbi:hypothetical protein N7488_001631 [Penicillium malachiteum]|nr:hypothetical protein N7488_001631 [Penicillium malachiteum]